MMSQMAKLPAALGLLGLMIFTVAEAAALQRVCMRANPGIGYVFQFRAAWGVSPAEFFAADEDRRPFNIDGVSGWSGDVLLTRSGCVDVSAAPADSILLVQLREGVNNRTYCRDWDNNEWGLARAHGDRETLWLDAWGLSSNMDCKLWKYE